MNHSILSNPFKKCIQIALSLLLGMAALGNGVAQASSACVHPTGAGHCFKSIQAAVDAANDGDVITIRPGNYVEQVTILGKKLSLVGRPGAVIQAPSAMEDTLSPVAFTEARPIILVADGNVTIRDLIVDGANSAENNPFLDGIVFINADGVIRGNLVKNIGFGAPRLPIVDGQPQYQGEAIVVVNLGETPRTVSIAENRIVNYNSVGITVFAQTLPDVAAPANLTVNVVNNTVLGSGQTDQIDQWGIFFGGYDSAVISGSLKDNHVRDQVALAPYPLPGVGVSALSTTNVEVSGNVIENVNLGLTITGTATQLVENRFKKTDIGILLLVEDSTFGSAIGTTLEDNRFESVPMDITTGPGAMFEAAASMKTAKANRLPR